MLYLIRSYMKLGKSILKVGYTDDVDKRMYQYFSANPGFDVLGIREGDEILEDMIQIYLTYLGYQRRVGKRLNEWFDDRPEIQQIFHIGRDRLENLLWRGREKVFNLARTTHLNIYEYLREKNLDSYLGVNYKLDENSNVIPIKYNKLDLYYQTSIINKNLDVETEPTGIDDLDNFIEEFYSTGNFSNKMKAYCEFIDQYGKDDYIIGIIDIRVPDPKFKSYYNLLGTEGCRARNYREDLIKRELSDYLYKDILSTEIYKTFKPGDKLLRRDIKTELSNIYNRLGINTAPKAIDLGKWFEINNTRITKDGKRNAAFEILAVKKN